MQPLLALWILSQDTFLCKMNITDIGKLFCVVICSSCCEDIVVVSEDEESTGEQNDIKRMMVKNLLMVEIALVL